MKLHKCKECGSIRLHPEKLICEECRDKRKRHCPDCGTVVTGRKTFCDKCAEIHKAESRKKYEKTQRGKPPAEPSPPTNYDWLNKFNSYLNANKETGISYGQMYAPAVMLRRRE